MGGLEKKSIENRNEKRNDSLHAWVRIQSLTIFSNNKKFVQSLLINFSVKIIFHQFANKPSRYEKINSSQSVIKKLHLRVDWNWNRLKSETKKSDNSYFKGCRDRVA